VAQTNNNIVWWLIKYRLFIKSSYVYEWKIIE
jgi:hypothetical protein